ncbi:MAG: alpha/beta hydrolase [Sandaracinus sp.]
MCGARGCTAADRADRGEGERREREGTAKDASGHDPERTLRRGAAFLEVVAARRPRHAPWLVRTPLDLWLLPGMDGTGQLFAPLLRELDPARLRPRVFSYDSHASSYDVLLRALPRPRAPTIVLAESFGGPLAIQLAARDRSRVTALVLVASFVRAPRPFLRAASALVARLPPPPASAIRAVMVGRDADPALVTQVASAVRATPATTLAARLAALADLDLRSASLDCPIHALVARHDRLVPRASAAEPAALSRQGAITTIDGPHLLAQTHPARVAEVLTTRLRELS